MIKLHHEPRISTDLGPLLFSKSSLMVFFMKVLHVFCQICPRYFISAGFQNGIFILKIMYSDENSRLGFGETVTDLISSTVADISCYF